MNYYTLAQDPNTPPETLTLLSQDGTVGVRWRVAGNPSTTPDILVILSQDKVYGVQWKVANNPNTPYGIWIQRWGRVLP